MSVTVLWLLNCKGQEDMDKSVRQAKVSEEEEAWGVDNDVCLMCEWVTDQLRRAAAAWGLDWSQSDIYAPRAATQLVEGTCYL